MLKVLAAGLCLMFLDGDAGSEDWKLILDLKGTWKFQIGDDPSWKDPRLNETGWKTISVPGEWEDQGYPGYDGYAWYRKTFFLPSGISARHLYLHMGIIDDVSEVFINGIQVGAEGAFPPEFSTAFATYQKIVIHPEYLKPGAENVIAVRVYDDKLSGGFVQGKIGFYQLTREIDPDIDLKGKWKFKTGDSPVWKDTALDDRDWKDVFVPALWETQGFTNYNGLAWYRKTFRVTEKQSKEPLVFLCGQVDDVDEVYLNGCFLGRTGKFFKETQYEGEYQVYRAYLIPPGTLEPGRENLLAVRVYDNFLNGGIYSGTVGLISLENLRKWEKKEKPHGQSKWDLLFN